MSPTTIDHASAASASPNGIWNEHTRDRCAQLLADGQMHWPEDLLPQQADELRDETCRRRRARLLRFIADRIAAELTESSYPSCSEPPDDQGHL